MSDAWPWYDMVAADVPITQGDLIRDCPLLGWRDDIRPEAVPAGGLAVLSDAADAFLRDVIVMTQACDLEQNKVSNVVLCPTQPLATARLEWELLQTARGQNPTAKAWRRYTEDVAAGYAWNASLLDGDDRPEVTTEVRVVFFQEIYTLPRSVLESVLAARGTPRLRLRPPYREHLSQSFARFFMRVGLPQSVRLPG